MAVNHAMALNLESADLRRSYEAGTFPREGWEIEYLENAKQATKNVDRALWVSFLYILICAIIGLTLATYSGKLHYTKPLDHSLLFIFSGTFLSAWATLMELGENMRTWSGECLHELLHPAIFKALFIPGTLFILAGTII
ncbi:hypothetical protein [Parendozoicomonas sp. Alg238-R29]|uniref:hypothetical protein n=1 Tax=Parendozoicomonas sp. Alg238-R29 TaxID=2993446 RepID=UPI00248EFED5|nr:hypothetical protein [Parendozoicomonas sp. Alg238-R29]